MTNTCFRSPARKLHPGWLVLSQACCASRLAAPAFAQDTTERARLDEIARVAGQQFIVAKAEAEANQTRPTVAAARLRARQWI